MEVIAVINAYLSADNPAGAAAADVTSQTITRCSCDVGCPCCGRCVESPSLSSSSWPPLPASSISALRDVDSFIARYQVLPPPPLIHSPPALSSDSVTWMLPLSSAQLDSSVSTLSCRKTLLKNSWELREPLTGTASRLVDHQSDVNSCGMLQQQNGESINQTDRSLNSTGPSLDFTACSMFSNSNADVQRCSDVLPAVAAAVIYSDATLEQTRSYPSLSQGLDSQPPEPCAPRVDSWNTAGRSLEKQGSSLAPDVSNNAASNFSTNVSDSSFLSAERTFYGGSTETDAAGTDPPISPVMSVAQQQETYWMQRTEDADSSHSTIQHDQVAAVKALIQSTALPLAPPASLISATAYLDRSAADYNGQSATHTLPRASSTRSLQATPPRPPPRSTTQNSYNASTLLGRSLPPEPPQITDTQATLDRICLYPGQMSTFQSPRALRDSGGRVGLSGSVQSLPGCDVTATSLAAASTTSRGRAAPPPPRRGSSMSPRLQTKSTRYGSRARSASVRSTDDDVDADVLLRLTGSSSTTSATLAGQHLEASEPSHPATNIAERETSRKATVSAQKPVAQIRPHAIRSPSASSYTRQRLNDDIDSKCSAAARTYEQQSSVQTQHVAHECSDVQSFTFASAGVSSNRQSGASSSASVSRFGTLRSRIRDYVTAAAGVSTNRKQQMTSSSFADWTLPRGRQLNVTRRSSSATSWEPDRSDYASSGNEPSRGTAALDDSAVWSSSSYFGVFPGPRPFSSPRTRATEVSLPQNIVASADSSTSTADVTSSIASRISTFLTFLGGSRRPVGSSPTSDTLPSTTLQPRPTSSATDSTRKALPSTNVSNVAKAVVDPIVVTLERQSRSVSSSPPVRSASTSEVLAKAAAAAAAAARDARGRQPLRFVREQRTSMSTFRNSGSLIVSVARSSSFSPHSTSAAGEAELSSQSADAFQVSDGRRTSKSGTLDMSAGQASLPARHPSAASHAHQSAPSTPLGWNDEDYTQPTMTSSLPVHSSIIRPPLTDETANTGENLLVTKEAQDVITDSSTPRTSCPTVPLSVFHQVDVEVERLIDLLQNVALPDNPPTERDADDKGAEVEAARESLLALTRQFVDDSQRLVSGATRSVDALVAGVQPSLSTLTRLTAQCQSTAALLTSPSHGVMLVGRVRDLAHAYRSTVSAARSAVGRPFNGVEMKSLMRQATSLAAILSSLIKMLNRTDIIC